MWPPARYFSPSALTATSVGAAHFEVAALQARDLATTEEVTAHREHCWAPTAAIRITCIPCIGQRPSRRICSLCHRTLQCVPLRPRGMRSQCRHSRETRVVVLVWSWFVFEFRLRSFRSTLKACRVLSSPSLKRGQVTGFLFRPVSLKCSY